MKLGDRRLDEVVQVIIWRFIFYANSMFYVVNSKSNNSLFRSSSTIKIISEPPELLFVPHLYAILFLFLDICITYY